MKFRFDINALRAIAIIGVLFFHYEISAFSGGFAGVDIFFVISGYLMSKIIIDGIENNKFRIIDFYTKRIKRIVPALFFLITAVSVLCYFLYFPKDYVRNEKNALSSLLFLSNFRYWKTSNYFDSSSNSNIFLHTWSLSVEWQFYILYPLVLTLFGKYYKRRLTWIMSFVFVTTIIFVISIYITQLNPTASFYLLPTRSWEMLFGGIAFLLGDLVRDTTYKKYLAILGYITIFCSLIFLKSDIYWPSFITIIPVFGTFMIIVANCSFHILKNQIIQFFGKISYSLYLWHWPVFVVAEYLGLPKQMASTLFLILVSSALAWISYKYVESIIFKNVHYYLLGTCIVFICILCFFDTNSIIFNQKTLDLANYRIIHSKEIESQFRHGTCFISTGQTGLKDYKQSDCLKIEKNKKNMILIGDSHAADISGSLIDAFSLVNINLNQVTASQCSPVLHTKGINRCTEIMDFVYKDYIIKHSKEIDGVIISANWIDFTKNNSQDLIEDLRTTINYLKKLGIKTVIIGQNEVYTVSYPYLAAKEYEYKISISKRYLKSNSFQTNNILKTGKERPACRCICRS